MDMSETANTSTCITCYDTNVIDHWGAEISCPDCPATERLEMMTVHTVWANIAGREFTRTKTYRAAWVADAMDMATADLPASCTDVLDQYMG